MTELSYDEFEKKLGDVALRCGWIFYMLFPGVQPLDKVEWALAKLYETQEILKDLGEQIKRYCKEHEAQEHLK